MKNYYYIIVNKRGTPLNAFHPNDIPSVFEFSNSSFDSFSTKSDIENTMKYIRREVKNKDNQQRWGEKYTERHIRTLKGLKIVKKKI